MSKIVRRTDLQIIKDDLRGLIIEPKEVNILTFKDIFSRVKNIKHFKEVMDTLMGFVTDSIYALESENLPPRERYELIIKTRSVCEVIETKKRMKITGLSTQYKNNIHNFSMEDGNYFLKISKKELAQLKEDAENDYSDDELKELAFKKRKIELLLELLSESRNYSRDSYTNILEAIARRFTFYLKLQAKRTPRRRRDLNNYLKAGYDPFLSPHKRDGLINLLDVDFQIRFFKDFDINKNGDEVDFDCVDFKKVVVPRYLVDELDDDFLEKEEKLLQDSLLDDAEFSIRHNELIKDYTKVVNNNKSTSFEQTKADNSLTELNLG